MRSPLRLEGNTLPHGKEHQVITVIPEVEAPTLFLTPTGDSIMVKYKLWLKLGLERCGERRKICAHHQLVTYLSQTWFRYVFVKINVMPFTRTHTKLLMCGYANVCWQYFRHSRHWEPSHIHTHTCTWVVAVTTPRITLTRSCWWAKQHVSEIECPCYSTVCVMTEEWWRGYTKLLLRKTV